MTDIRSRLADALMDGVGADERDAYQAVDALLSLSGIAIVELPEPKMTRTSDPEEPIATWTFGDWEQNQIDAWDLEPALSVKAADFSFGRDISKREAREFAAALLAAAVQAQEEQ